ncbi:hypothetical protein AVEN_201914-1, partial [Araneus ventricosus]
ISRGIDPEKIQDCNLWWFGPSFLQDHSVVSPCVCSDINDNELYQREFKKTPTDPVCLVVQGQEVLPIINNCSSFIRLQRVIGWCVRFVRNAKNSLQPNEGNLTSPELFKSLMCLVKNVQANCFAQEIQCLKSGQQLPNSSSLINLSPFLDEQDILRVGGRLKNSNLPIERKHQILLPYNNHFSDLIINHFHVLYLHTGAEATLANIRTKFWLINGRNYVRKIIRKCIPCLKSVHLEIVNSCSTDAFIGALKRFIARRGKPSDIYSDNGTNFVGANNGCENTITDKTQIVITAQQKLNGVKVLEEELETLFKQYLDIEEDEKCSNKSDEEMLELLEERDEIEISLKCLLSKYNFNEVTMIENKSNHDSDLKSYIDHIELKSKLPEIPLPIFYGKIEEFSNFKNQFVSLISDNKELTNDQKLFYLKAVLRGEAKLIETSDDTFESLFSALEERFENKRAVVDIHIQNILKIENLYFESSKGLRNITDTINNSLRALKSFKLDCNNSTNAILVNIILERLDKDTRKAYELFIQTKGIPSLNELLKFLESRAMVRDQLGNTPSNNKFRKEFQGSAYKSKNFFVNSNKGNHVIKKCILCKIDHPLHKCYEFLKLSIAKRIEFIEKHHLCKNCLKMHNAPCKAKRIQAIPSATKQYSRVACTARFHGD